MQIRRIWGMGGGGGEEVAEMGRRRSVGNGPCGSDGRLVWPLGPEEMDVKGRPSPTAAQLEKMEASDG